MGMVGYPDWDGRRKWANGGDYQSCWRFSLDASNSLAYSVCYRHWTCSQRSFEKAAEKPTTNI